MSSAAIVWSAAPYPARQGRLGQLDEVGGTSPEPGGLHRGDGDGSDEAAFVGPGGGAAGQRHQLLRALVVAAPGAITVGQQAACERPDDARLTI